MEILIRPAVHVDAAAIAGVHVASWQATYRGILPDAYLDGLGTSMSARTVRWEAGLRQPEVPGTATFVAECDGIVAGFAVAGPNRKPPADFAGELHAIYVLDAHCGRGVGRRLFARCVDHLRGSGHDDLLVWVLERNPACGFYRAVGGALVPGAGQAVTIAGTPLVVVAYGWRPLPTLMPCE